MPLAKRVLTASEKCAPQRRHGSSAATLSSGPMTLAGGEYAIHGTAWPNWVKLRAAVSLGCIRMLNTDVIQVYNRIKVGTPVVVTSN